MEFPIEIQRLINEYAKPCTIPDWRKGCYYNRRVIQYNQISRCTSRYSFKRCIEYIYNIHKQRFVTHIISLHTYYAHYGNIELYDMNYE